MLTPVTKISSEVYEVRCVNCGKQVGLIEAREITAFLTYILYSRELVFCFDCDNTRLDEIPSQLMVDGFPACLVIHN